MDRKKENCMTTNKNSIRLSDATPEHLAELSRSMDVLINPAVNRSLMHLAPHAAQLRAVGIRIVMTPEAMEVMMSKGLEENGLAANSLINDHGRIHSHREWMEIRQKKASTAASPIAGFFSKWLKPFQSHKKRSTIPE